MAATVQAASRGGDECSRPWAASGWSEDAKTRTPRSSGSAAESEATALWDGHAAEELDHLALTDRRVPTRPCAEDEDDETEDVSDDGEVADEEAYYAFLRELAGSFEAASESEEESDGEEVEGPRTPLADARPPVEDDYDVIEAIADYAAKRTGTAAEQRRSDLQSAAAQLRKQAACLQASAARGDGSSTPVCDHYLRVSEEMIQEAVQLEAELATL
eukprot:gb/GFBE01042534.1/.p1 GENE.gb/GFBE01042534.1/~~gb/GFBE01042534.1/.p1  ORF type:complete len:217 (+),score=55.18 gb/GFBE01042534.1/:1-651(+)